MAIPITARAPVPFTPPSVPKKLLKIDKSTGEHEFAVFVRVPTLVERDSYAAALIRAGVVSYTKQNIRDMALAGVQSLFEEKEHDEIQTLLREHWEAADAEVRANEEQRRVLIELHEKAIAEGGEKAVPKPADVTKALNEIKPDVVMDPQRHIKAVSVNQEIVANFPPLRQAMAALADQDAKRSWLNVKVYVTGWRGLPDEPEGNPNGGITQAEAEYLRSHIGQEAFLELSDFITALAGLDEDEEKNLASLLENLSAPIGSTQQTSTASSEDGNSTGGRSGSTRAKKGSRTTSGSSSGSKTGSGTRKKAASGNGRTDGP